MKKKKKIRKEMRREKEKGYEQQLQLQIKRCSVKKREIFFGFKQKECFWLPFLWIVFLMKLKRRRKLPPLQKRVVYNSSFGRDLHTKSSLKHRFQHKVNGKKFSLQNTHFLQYKWKGWMQTRSFSSYTHIWGPLFAASFQKSFSSFLCWHFLDRNKRWGTECVSLSVTVIIIEVRNLL